MSGNERLLSGIEATENEVARAIQENHSHELEVIYAALEQILRGYNEFADQKERLDDKLESAQLFLAVRSFNSLRVAVEVLENGYAQQALTLIRTVMEDQLVVKDIENYPPTLNVIFDDPDKMGKGKFRFQSMAERLTPEAKSEWGKKYRFASSFAAHPQPLSMHKIIAFKADGKMILQPGSRYDRTAVVAVLFFALRELQLVMTTIAKLTSSLGSHWENDALIDKKKVETAMWNLAKEAKGELEEMDKTPG